jgi:type VI secretion system secreted protein Hcp
MSQEEANRIVQAAHRMRRSGKTLKIALPTVAALGAGAAVAVGSIPGGDGTITGCYVTNTDAANLRYGSLRVIDPSLPANPTGAPNFQRSCEQDEATISWNQRGPTGPPGAPGSQGAQGVAGAPLIGETSFGLKSAGNTFLKLDGIKGEITAKFHKGEIPITSSALGITQTGHASGGGGGAGKTIETFTITKRLDKSSPRLLLACANGTHIKSAVITFARKAGKGQQDYLKIKLDQVLISSIQQGSSSKGAPTEQLTLNFTKATETFLGGAFGGKGSVKVNIGLTNNKV